MFTSVRVFALASFFVGNLTQAEEFSDWYVTPTLNYHFFDDDGEVDDMASLGGTVGYQLNQSWAFELGMSFGSSDSIFDEKVDYSRFNLDALYLFNRKGNWQPYGVLSLARQSFKEQDTRSEVIGAAGMGTYYQISDSLRLRSDVRASYSESNNLIDTQVSIGFEWRFGDSPAKKAIVIPSTKPAVVSSNEVAADDAPVVAAAPLAIELPNHIVTFNFSSESTTVHEPHLNKMDEIAQYMKQHPQAILNIEGDADSTGSEAYNLTLSKRRAQALEQLIEQKYGIEKNRITIKALGESNPIADNKTDTGRAENRRVDIRIGVQHDEAK